MIPLAILVLISTSLVPAEQAPTAGVKAICIYPLLPDGTCWFIATELAGAGWRPRAAAIHAACRDARIDVAIERVSTGAGARAWIFFDAPAAASRARSLAFRIIEAARQHGLSDPESVRVYPDLDAPSDAELGAAIALPLDRDPVSEEVSLERIAPPAPAGRRDAHGIPRSEHDALVLGHVLRDVRAVADLELDLGHLPVAAAVEAGGREAPAIAENAADRLAGEDAQLELHSAAAAMHARAVSQLQLETDLRRALDREEFRIYYQPIFSLESGRVCGFEALVQW